MQIGQDRSGFYSYTILENMFGADMPKVERLVPEWKPRAVGETVWFATPKRFGGQGKMIPAIVEPNRALVLVMANDWQKIQQGDHAEEGMWTFTLDPLLDGQTRLIARLRSGTTSYDCFTPGRQIVLGTRPLCDGAEDAPQNPRLIGAWLGLSCT